MMITAKCAKGESHRDLVKRVISELGLTDEALTRFDVLISKGCDEYIAAIDAISLCAKSFPNSDVTIGFF